MGATLMTEFPVVARDTLHADGTVLTLLLSVFAVGVGVGFDAVRTAAAWRVSPRLVPFAALGISLFCWDFRIAPPRRLATSPMPPSRWHRSPAGA